MQASVAKCHASDTGPQVTADAAQIFGGHGYVKDYLVEKCMRAANLHPIYEGRNQIQRQVIA
jgi:alkylation response protein AidB-like acyl-CoA dehydrogenase